MWKTKSGILIEQLLSGRSNVFLVRSSDSSLLVDTSWVPARRKLQSTLDHLEYNLNRCLTALFLTHTHFDHAGNAAWVHERYRPDLILQQSEVGFLCNGDNPLPSGTNPLTRLFLPRFGPRLQSIVRYPPTCPDISFDDYLDLSTIGLRAYLLHTPGHSIGSSSLIIDDEIALVGDTLYGVFPNSALPPFADDPALLMQSWEKLLDAGCKLYLPSHGKAILRVVLERDYLKQKPKYLSQQRSMI